MEIANGDILNVFEALILLFFCVVVVCLFNLFNKKDKYITLRSAIDSGCMAACSIAAYIYFTKTGRGGIFHGMLIGLLALLISRMAGNIIMKLLARNKKFKDYIMNDEYTKDNFNK